MSQLFELAYIGSVVPDSPEYRNPAVSPASNMFQENLLAGLQAAGTTPSLVLSCRPMAAFPGSSRFAVKSGRGRLACGIPVRLIPFVNLSPVKQLMVGLGVFCSLLWWGWKHRARIRIVYTYNLTVPPGLFTFLAARFIGALAVASVNDICEPGETVPPTWARRLDYQLHKLLLPRFDALVVVSEKIIQDFAPRVRYSLVEGGLTPEMVAEPSSLDGPDRPDRFTVVFAGSMREWNGVEIMLRAISQLEGERYRFVFAGGGPLSEAVRQAAKEDSRIEYLGFLKLHDLLSIYRQADVLISMRVTKALRTTYFFPSKLMELLASGTPVISTCTGHVEAEFGEFLFPLRNESPEGLAKAIRDAAATDLETRRDMGRRARAFMLANKTWQIQTGKINGILRSIAGAPSDWSPSCR
jgi:glycosyltransferase involved in cell wall biosynthesis